ncbi:MAG TPA: hypothetical protein VNC50_03045, partial [Planctomycetia bacterium]|nr:hypothetical protein [Planctomycetia bacterium]
AIHLGGGGTITISPMASGPYQGISVFQSRSSDPDTLFIVQGNGDSDLTGTFYMPTTRCQITGTGDQRLGSQYIARTLEVSGSGNFLIDFNAARAPSPPIIELVE